jgi:energy-coupling factor transporter transmembrane protein EcfT
MADHSHKHSSRRKLHRDWRAWLALLLMLAAIVMYVLTLDDSIVPR